MENQEKRLKLTQSLLDTEIEYVNNLSLLETYYLSKIPDIKIESESIRTAFNYFQSIQLLHQQLLNGFLEGRKPDQMDKSRNSLSNRASTINKRTTLNEGSYSQSFSTVEEKTNITDENNEEDEILARNDPKYAKLFRSTTNIKKKQEANKSIKIKDKYTIRKSETDIIKIYSKLLEYQDKMSIYKLYFPVYHSAINSLTEILQLQRYAPKYEMLSTEPELEGKSIFDLLILPFQRITEYEAYITAYIKLSKATDIGIMELQNFLRTIKQYSKIAENHSSNSAKDLEFRQLWEMFNLDPILEPKDFSRSIILQKYVKSPDSTHDFLFVVFDDSILIGQQKSDRYITKSFCSLQWISIEQISYFKDTFTILTPDKPFTFKLLDGDIASFVKQVNSIVLQYKQFLYNEKQQLFAKMTPNCENSVCPTRESHLLFKDRCICNVCNHTFCKKCSIIWDTMECSSPSPVAIKESITKRRGTAVNYQEEKKDLVMKDNWANICVVCYQRIKNESNENEENKEIYKLTVEVDTESIPVGWENRFNGIENTYHNNITQENITIHPNIKFYLEKEKRDEILDNKWYRLYNRNGCRYYWNIETGENAWELPKNEDI